ncbi:Lsa36 family surface (lipo)protein [Leptospira interrogans serovar Pomona]|uniref:Lsa36 family surface (lipo)protein n=1 Tax=Leptospira interrogans TaxID=173 RepID=UPI003CF0CE8E
MMNTFRSLVVGKFFPILVFSFIGFLTPANSLIAQIECSGAACTVIPSNISSQFNGLEYEIHTKYLNEVVDSMEDAALLTTINSSMMGNGSINRFQVGAGLSAAGVKNDDIQIQYGGITLPNLPNGGASLAPTLMAGVNLGWLTGNGPADQKDKDEKDDGGRSFLHRINIFAHGFQGKLDQGDLKELNDQSDQYKFSGNYNSFGATVRFQLIRERYTRLDFFGFTGLSLGLGFHRKTEEMNLGYSPTQIPKISFGPATGRWDADFALDYRSRSQSLPIDIRTGVRLFYFLTIFVGAGMSQNSGNSNIHLGVTGPMVLTLDAAAAGLPIDFLKGQAASSTGNLAIRSHGDARAKDSVNYLLGGVEINLLTFKILVEGVVSDKIYSANVGVKFAL